MVTSGSPRRTARPARIVAGLATAVGLVATAGLVACTSSDHLGDRPATYPSGAVPSPQRRPATRPAVPATDFCRVGLPESWQTHLAGGSLDQRAGETLTVHAVGRDGRTVVVDARTAGGRTVLFVRDGHRRSVLRLARAGTDQLLGAGYDGRHLVFSVSHDPADLSDWTLYAWDSRSSAPPRTLATNATDEQGRPVPGPMLYPVVAAGHAAWTEAVRGGGTRLHRYDLADGTDHVVRTGHPGAPFLLGDDLAWPESPAPDALTVLHAVSMTTGARVALPAAMAGVRGPAFIA
ncbi:MAG: hypothetical protein WCA46_25960, partial [Actinocatenispora sp.]